MGEPRTFGQLIHLVHGAPQVAPLLTLLHQVPQDAGAPRVAWGDPGQVDAVLEGAGHLRGRGSPRVCWEIGICVNGAS